MLVFDPRSAGVSADMILGALLGLGAETRSVEANLRALDEDVFVEKADVAKGEILAVEARIRVKERGFSGFSELEGLMERILYEGELPVKRWNHCFAVLKTLENAADAEFTYGSQTIADIIGVVTCLNELGAFDKDILSFPVAVGIPQTENQGIAVMKMLKREELFVRKGVENELSTPTGVALLLNVAEFVENCNAMGREVYGAGKKEFSFPNVLKVIQV